MTAVKEINIADTVLRKRREKGVTQEELAAYIGVSKASVSKWETGQSYPDITFLPQLAAYFNISIDELIGYEPQMTTGDIRALYRSLCEEFASNPFDSVMEKCRGIIKKYYSCFPLLMQMGTLIINYSICIEDAHTKKDIFSECLALFERIELESGDVELSRQAIQMEAFCHILLGNPEQVLGLLGETILPAMTPETLLTNAYIMLGQTEKAKETMQIGLYQHLLALLDDCPVFFSIYPDEPQKFDEIVSRTLSLCETFQIDCLHPAAALKSYLTAAQGYCAAGETDKAIGLLKKYCTVFLNLSFPLQLHGDEFFDLLDPWFQTLELGTMMPRDERSVRQSMIRSVTENPAFTPLCSDPRYKSILDKLNSHMK